MSTLDNLTARILGESEKKALEILSSAKSEAERIVKDMADDAERQKEKIISDAKVEAVQREDRLVMGKTLAVRDENLEAKQKMLDQVFAEALNRLNGMPEAEFNSFLTGYLSALELDGEELILPEKYRPKNLDALNEALKKAGRKGNLKLSKEDRRIEGGFILTKGGIEQNNTFESLIAYYRYELEGEVIAALY